MTIPSSNLLRLALGADAASCATVGALLLAGAGPLSGALGLPETLLRGAGVLLLPFAAGLAALASRSSVPRAAVLAVIGLNLLWIADSLLVLLAGWFQPTGLGIAFVLIQLAAVAVLTEMEWIGLRRSRAAPTITA